jgi:hypothetical protein
MVGSLLAQVRAWRSRASFLRIIFQAHPVVNYCRESAMPHKRMKKPSEAERDYSHRSLLDKLGVKPGQKILILDVDDPSFLNDIQPFSPVFAERRAAADLEVIFFGAGQKKDLGRLAPLRRAIVSNGAIWVVYPKGRKEIREIDVIAAGKSAGLVDNKVVGFSATHTSLRFVIPLANR